MSNKKGQDSVYPLVSTAGFSVVSKGMNERNFIALQILSSIVSKQGQGDKQVQVQEAFQYAVLFLEEASQ